ncbi:MAG: SGNH/GDSL hydrolase family protein [Nocardioidaceae bacterium]
MRRPAVTAVMTALCLLLAGCWSGQGAEVGGAPSRPASSAAPRFGSYVALGDSYTAGPLVPTTDVANGCFRSDHNYPSLLARRLGTHLTDVSCSGATTADLTRRQHTFQQGFAPPQLRAVHRDTDLVTLGIGGNDLDLFATLVQTCTRLRATDPSGSPCTDQVGATAAASTRQIGDRVTRAVRAVRRKAPHATVVLVGYLRLAPDRGTCPALPLAAGDYALGRRVSRGLNAAVRSAARRTGVEFLDAYALSKGHDVCSSTPWVNGSVTDQQRAAAYHPFAAGMRAEAAALAKLLTR